MENENKTRYDEIKEKISKHIEKDFTIPTDFTIPLEYSVVVKKIDMGQHVTDTGIILGEGRASNRVFPHVGIIVAVGPKAPEYLVPGLRIYFSQNEDLEFWIGGGFYNLMHYTSIYSTVPASAFVTMDTKDDKELMREKKIEDSSNYELRMKSKGEEEKDLKDFLSKKNKTIILPGDFKA